ncbi:hypothetical protein FB451DRAFT_1561686 [Mycena latifolia]|nr:hypothetical protein FB451DRAFT_1561686 [Mycena latifolia]
MSPPTPALIPRPAWAPSRIDAYPTASLRDAIGWTEADFKRFKVHVASNAAAFRLDTYAPPRAQEDGKWGQLVEECVKAFPALSAFDGAWPVEFYYTGYAYWRRMNKRRRQTTAALSGQGSDAAQRTRTEQSGPDREKGKEKGNSGARSGDGERAAMNLRQSTSSTQGPASKPPHLNERQSASQRTSASQATPSWPPAQPNLNERSASQQISGSQSAPSWPPAQPDLNQRSLSRRVAPTWPPTQPNLNERVHHGGERQAAPPTRLHKENLSQQQPSSQRTSGTQDAPSSSEPESKPLAARRSEISSTMRRESSSSSSQTTSSNTSTSSSSEPIPTAPRRSQTAKQKAIWSTCVLCGFRPPIPPEQTIELQLFFNGRDDLRRVLATVGIVADHHLRALLRVGAKQREVFLRSITPNYLTYLDKVEIADFLDTYIEQNREVPTSNRPAKVQLTAIPRPPEEFEKILSQHICSHVHVKKHMRIADDDEYFDLVDSIEAEIPRYLDVSMSFEEQTDAQIYALLKSVCEDRPSLRKYPDCWPVLLHIKRFLHAQEAGQSRMQRTPPRHECPRQRAHPAADVPPSVAALLADYGMQELGPAFLFLGIKTDEKFANMIFISKTAKSQLIAELAPLGCSVFQGMMMRYIIEQV